jgi:hypothetical protein
MDTTSDTSPADARARADETPEEAAVTWPLWQRILFRFFFVYLLLQIAPWTWLSRVRALSFVSRNWYRLADRAVQTSNSRLFHVRDTLVPTNGSGDTSWAWTQLWLYLSVALVACVIWSALDRRRTGYPRLGYWLRTIVRYYIATFALSYGIIKIFLLQMPFPGLSQLATPLGDLLPMRLSWLFIGYSAKYQFFSGLMETVAGLLLLFRPTVTLGLLAATGAFLNVVMINMSYDVPVKLFASHLLLACIFLLLLDSRRLLTLFVLNRPVPATDAYEPYFSKRWMRWAALAVKLALIWFILVQPFRQGWRSHDAVTHQPPAKPFAVGVYDVRTFVIGSDTIPAVTSDPRRWHDVIFDNAASGSVGTTDTLFWQRYRRGYFRYKAEPDEKTAVVWKSFFRTGTPLDSTFLFKFRYEQPDSSTIRFWTAIRGDSVYVELARTDRHYQLAERQFHWLSEFNR